MVLIVSTSKRNPQAFFSQSSTLAMIRVVVKTSPFINEVPSHRGKEATKPKDYVLEHQKRLRGEATTPRGPPIIIFSIYTL